MKPGTKRRGQRKDRKLTYELCKDVCSHFENISQVYKNDQAVAQKCRRMGWTLDFFPDTKCIKKGRELTYEVCKEVCSRYKNPVDLNKHDPAVRSKCYDTGWIYEFYPDTKRITRKLDYETCRKSAKRFKTRMEFREGDPAAYKKAASMGWVDDFGLYSPGSEKYPEEYVIELAKQFKYHRDFRLKYPLIYDAAFKRGTLDKCKWLMRAYEKPEKEPSFSLYVYEFKKTNAAYVGITVNKKARHNDHLQDGDSVADYARSVSLKVPSPKYLKNGMSRKDAQKAEKAMIAEYRKNGWNMINKATGGSVGSLGSDYWTKKRCIETARNYTLVVDLAADFRGCWQKIRDNGWEKDCPWLKRLQVIQGTWKNMSKEEASRIAKKCRNRTEFFRKYRILYPIAKEKGWVDEWFPPRFEYKNLPKEVVAYELDGVTEIGRFPSISAATRAFGGRKGNINACVNGLIQSAYGKIFRFASTDAT